MQAYASRIGRRWISSGPTSVQMLSVLYVCIARSIGFARGESYGQERGYGGRRFSVILAHRTVLYVYTYRAEAAPLPGQDGVVVLFLPPVLYWTCERRRGRRSQLGKCLCHPRALLWCILIETVLHTSGSGDDRSLSSSLFRPAFSDFARLIPSQESYTQ